MPAAERHSFLPEVPVTRSRKLFVVSLVLAAGYGAAVVIGQLTLLLPSPAASSADVSEPTGWWASLQPTVPRGDAAPAAGALIPETQYALQRAQQPTLSASNVPYQPVWLRPASEAGFRPLIADQPASAAAPSLNARRPIDSVVDTRASAVSNHATPTARITNVVAASAASTRPASPWDRWPQWDANDSAVKRGPIAATFQDTDAANSNSQRAKSSELEVVRKNSPALDLGIAAPGPSGRTHLVVDGDSLAKLAALYLDDPALGDEIYRLNRDVLTSPELLPIGVELRIPDKRMADATAGLPPIPDLDSVRPRAPSGMVPVEWTPRAFDRVPQVELLSPIAADDAD